MHIFRHLTEWLVNGEVGMGIKNQGLGEKNRID